jgi:hypothetical protein
VHLEIKDINANECLIQIWQDMFSYRINQWIPLNHNNYMKYKDIDGIVDKYAMLEGILTGNILSFAKGVGIYFDQKVVCKITDISASRLTRYKGVCIPVDTRSVIPVIPVHSGCDFRYGFTKLVLFT